ncbi:zinc finger MYM-type protein 1-like [Hydra vulgaris]|uniref:Zinc finger MYM-type protein 1-like n=1 Tax=Hydra vulgaris TaxID=6087 RepID=A0ABM4BMF4_HYDVU
MILSETFCNSIKKPNENIDTRFDEERKINIERNRHIVKTIAEAIFFSVRQCIALRGDQETLSASDNSIKYNQGNFLAALQIIAKHDEILHKHLSHIGISNRNAKYTSPRFQNEIITIIGYDIICSDLIKEIKAATFYSILADEVASHNREEHAFCMRFVDQNKDIREEFSSFLHVPRIAGEVIASTVIQFLQDVNLDLKNIGGQGYDGVANMSSDNVGVQRKIKNESPKAVYVHCSGHCLNLVIARSCSLPNTRDTIAKLKNCCLFYLASPKRKSLLQSIIMKALPDISKPRKSLIDLCRTRWSSRHDSYRHFYQATCYVIIALEYIAYGANKDACGEDFTNVT